MVVAVDGDCGNDCDWHKVLLELKIHFEELCDDFDRELRVEYYDDSSSATLGNDSFPLRQAKDVDDEAWLLFSACFANHVKLLTALSFESDVGYIRVWARGPVVPKAVADGMFGSVDENII